MDKALFLDFKPQDEMSDTMSTSATSINHLHNEEASPSNSMSIDTPEGEGISQSKKIRKKRNAYQKIDDDVRMRLLEAVKKGETLKSAAKRLQVNYSSAKSIFHIYRKEGRILKKATTDKGFEFGFPSQPEPVLPPYMMNPNAMRMHPSYPKSIFFQSSQPSTGTSHLEEGSGSSSPLNNLVGDFSDLLKIGNNAVTGNQMNKNKPFMPSQPSQFNMQANQMNGFAKLQAQQQMYQQQQHQMQQQNQNQYQYQQQQQQFQQQRQNQINQMIQFHQMNQQANSMSPVSSMFNSSQHPMNQCNPITFASKPQNMMSPAERMKQYDNFYMNYSNSPLSGNAGKIGSESGSNKYQQKEFDSFSDMVSALQTNNHLAPKLNMSASQTPQQNQEKFEMRALEEEGNLEGNIESMAFDTYQSLMDAQMKLSHAYQKASLLNNLVQIQKISGSPSSRLLN